MLQKEPLSVDVIDDQQHGQDYPMVHHIYTSPNQENQGRTFEKSNNTGDTILARHRQVELALGSPQYKDQAHRWCVGSIHPHKGGPHISSFPDEAFG